MEKSYPGDKLINIPFTYDTLNVLARTRRILRIYKSNVQIPRSDKAEELIKSIPATLRFNNDRHEQDLRLEGNKEEPLHLEYDQKSSSDFFRFQPSNQIFRKLPPSHYFCRINCPFILSTMP